MKVTWSSLTFFFVAVVGAAAATTKCSKEYEQCGGKGWHGPHCCYAGHACFKRNNYYSQCVPSGSTPKPTPKPTPTPACKPRLAVGFLVGDQVYTTTSEMEGNGFMCYNEAYRGSLGGTILAALGYDDYFANRDKIFVSYGANCYVSIWNIKTFDEQAVIDAIGQISELNVEATCAV